MGYRDVIGQQTRNHQVYIFSVAVVGDIDCNEDPVHLWQLVTMMMMMMMAVQIDGMTELLSTNWLSSVSPIAFGEA